MERITIIKQTSTIYAYVASPIFFFLSCFCFPQSRTSAHLNESAYIELYPTFSLVFAGVFYVLFNMLCSIHCAFFRLYINLY